jgi:hypothetical protein
MEIGGPGRSRSGQAAIEHEPSHRRSPTGITPPQPIEGGAKQTRIYGRQVPREKTFRQPQPG